MSDKKEEKLTTIIGAVYTEWECPDCSYPNREDRVVNNEKVICYKCGKYVWLET